LKGFFIRSFEVHSNLVNEPQLIAKAEAAKLPDAAIPGLDRFLCREKEKPGRISAFTV
jgi:hypothetical protein